MRPKTKVFLIVLCGLLILGPVVAWLATGTKGYTRFRDAAVEQTNQQSELGDLFAEAGAKTLQEVESVNAIGLLPSGPGLASLSVATVGGAGIVGLGVVLWVDRRKRKKSSTAQ